MLAEKRSKLCGGLRLQRVDDFVSWQTRHGAVPLAFDGCTGNATRFIVWHSRDCLSAHECAHPFARPSSRKALACLVRRLSHSARDHKPGVERKTTEEDYGGVGYYDMHLVCHRQALPTLNAAPYWRMLEAGARIIASEMTDTEPKQVTVSIAAERIPDRQVSSEKNSPRVLL